ncbi:MAG: hypothetical protein RIC91_02970 [Gammaproteobacteria bacterium]
MPDQISAQDLTSLFKPCYRRIPGNQSGAQLCHIKHMADLLHVNAYTSGKKANKLDKLITYIILKALYGIQMWNSGFAKCRQVHAV